MAGDLVPLLSGLAVLCTAVASVLGVVLTRSSGRRDSASGELRTLLDERRSDRAEDRAEIDRLERELRDLRKQSAAWRSQLDRAGITPAGNGNGSVKP